MITARIYGKKLFRYRSRRSTLREDKDLPFDSKLCTLFGREPDLGRMLPSSQVFDSSMLIRPVSQSPTALTRRRRPASSSQRPLALFLRPWFCLLWYAVPSACRRER